MKKIILFAIFFSSIQLTFAQSEEQLIRETLNNYIEGSTNGQPNLLKKAFHADLNLYYVKNDKYAVWSGEDYIKDTKEGQPTGESGEILKIDFDRRRQCNFQSGERCPLRHCCSHRIH